MKKKIIGFLITLLLLLFLPTAQAKPLMGLGDVSTRMGFPLLNTGGNVLGVQANLTVIKDNWNFPAQSPDRDQLFYAPAFMPPNNSCLEAAVVHLRTAGSGTTQHNFGFYDWCAGDGTGGWQYYVSLSSIWTAHTQQDYPTPDRTMSVRITKSGNCSTGWLFNYSTFTWQSKAVSCGTNPYNDVNGWVWFEAYGSIAEPGAACLGPMGSYNRVKTDWITYAPYTSYITSSNRGPTTQPLPNTACFTYAVGGHAYSYTEPTTTSWVMTWY